MPIVDIQRRFRELGRIRLGHKVKTGKVYDRGPRQGQPIEKPVKLPAFRITSPWGHLIEQAAEVFGGTCQPWDNDGAAEFEVITERADEHGIAYLPVVIPPGEILDQWYELWKGGGLLRRCDGVRQTLVDRSCSCPADPLERQALAAKGEACKPTTRLRVMLPDVSDVGIWRLETHGFHAAAELGGAAGLVEVATRRGAMIPADLRLQPREGSRRPGEPRKKFFVPAISFRGTLGPVLDALGILETGAEMPVLLGVEPRPALNAGGAEELPPAGTAFDPRPTEAASFPGPPPDPEPAGPADTPAPDTPDAGEPDGFEPPADTAPEVPDVEEPEAFEPPPAQPEPGSERSYSGPQIIAIKLDERGITDRAARLAIVGRMIGRTIDTSKDLTAPEIRAVLEILNDDRRFADLDTEAEDPATVASGGEAVESEGPASLPPNEETTPVATAPAPPPPPSDREVVKPDAVTTGERPARRRRAPAPASAPEPPARPEEWTADAWRAFLASRSVKATETIREAVRLAREAGNAPPGTLDDLAGSGLCDLLVGFVEDLALERGSS